MFKSLVQPHVDYCSVLWMPQEGCSMDKVEKVLRDFSRRIPELRGICYWLLAAEAADELTAATPKALLADIHL